MTSDQDSTTAQQAKVAELVEQSRIAVVTTVAESGKLVGRPLAVQHRQFDGELWFFTQDPSHKTEQVARNPQVHPPVPGDGGGEQRLDRGLVGDVGGHRVQAVGADRRDLLEGVGPTTGQHHPPAGVDERGRRRRPDPAACSGHHGHLCAHRVSLPRPSPCGVWEFAR